MNRLLFPLFGMLLLMSACQTDPLTESEVTEFVHQFSAAQNQGEASVQPFIDGLASDFSYFNARQDSAKSFDASLVTADWFDADTSYNAIHRISVGPSGASVYGVSTDVYGSLKDEAKFLGFVVRENGSLVWKRWMHVNTFAMSTNMMDPTTDNEAAEDYFWSMYRSIMRNEFGKAGAYADSALMEDEGLALAYLGKMLQAGVVDADPEAWAAAYDAGLVALDDETLAEKLFVTAFGLKGEERLQQASKALILAPHDPWMLAFYSYWLEDLDESVAVLQRGLERWPYMGAFHNLLGYRYMALDDMDAAKEHFELQIRFLGEAANPWDSMGDYYVAAGNNEEAIKCYEKAFELDASFVVSQEKSNKLKGDS